MYVCGLIPGKFAELAEAVPIEGFRCLVTFKMTVLRGYRDDPV